jgi:cytochrome c553
MQPAIPGLVGLLDYIAAQLSAWKTGARANAPDCMHEVATRLVATDIPPGQVARGTPGRRHTATCWQKLPLSCGGQVIDGGDRARRCCLPAAAAWSAPSCCPRYDVPATGAGAQAGADVVARGEYLTRAGDCVACHTVRGGQPFAGGLELATPFGSLITPNITPMANDTIRSHLVCGRDGGA